MKKSKVYFIPHKRSESSQAVRTKLSKILKSSGAFKELYSKSKDKTLIAVKIHAGEEGNTSYIQSDYIKHLPDELRKAGFNPFLTDTNVLYHGRRMNSVDHLNIFRKHGFHKLNLPIIISDGLMGNDYIEVEVSGKYFKSVKVAKAIYEVDTIISIAHLTGHMLTGFGAAIKNIGMGCASRVGKYEQHCSINPNIEAKICEKCGVCFDICPASAIVKKDDKFVIDEDACIGCAQCINVCRISAINITWDEDSTQLQERMVEYTHGILKNKESFFINFASFITKDCDCMNYDQRQEISDVGILASFDPVALDKASVDLVNEQEGMDVFKSFWPDTNYNIQLDYASKLGLGSVDYELISC